MLPVESAHPGRGPVDRPLGVTALSLFFAAGALISGVGAVALAFPGSRLEALWRLNPEARGAFGPLGPWAVVLMLGVMAACTGAAVGLWRVDRWGRFAAMALLGVNLLGDLLNGLVRVTGARSSGCRSAGRCWATC